MLPYRNMISINAKLKTPIYLQITNGVIKQIVKGRIKPGIKMPGSRKMAEQLGVHRNTVITSYEELESQGWISARPGKGNFVNEDLPIFTQGEENALEKKTKSLKNSGFRIQDERYGRSKHKFWPASNQSL